MAGTNRGVFPIEPRCEEVTLDILSWRQIDFSGVVLAGLMAGYLMALAGLWADRIPGLAAVDIADFGRRYMISDRPSAWLFGLISHLANSIILTFLFAVAVVPNFTWPRWLAGSIYGLFLSIVLAGLLVSPMAGLGFMGRKAGGPGYAITDMLIHLLWGVLIGLIYVPL